MPAFQAENEGASPSYRTKNLESRDSIAFVVQWFTTPDCHSGDEGSIPSDCTKREHQFPHGFLAQLAEQQPS
jgi:hypothetical protein